MQGSQNISIETWMRAAKFNEKVLIRFEDINKIQTDFPRSEVFLRSVMHNHSPSFNDFCNNYQRRYQMRLKANKYHIL